MHANLPGPAGMNGVNGKGHGKGGAMPVPLETTCTVSSQEGMRINLAVPEGLAVGEPVQFLTPDGRSMQAVVPEVLMEDRLMPVTIPGRMLKVKIPAGAQPNFPVQFTVEDHPDKVIAVIPASIAEGDDTFPFYLPPEADVHTGHLCREAQVGNLDGVQLALSKGASVNAVFSMGFTALFYAATHGHLHIAQFLLKERADVAWQNTEGRTALHWSARNGHVEVAEELIRASAPLGTKDNGGKTPLCVAMDKGQEGTIALLTKYGAPQ